MPKKGKNIYLRKDGRWEGRYVKGHLNGKIQYGYVYGKTYEDVENRLTYFEIVKLKTNKVDTLENISYEWLQIQKPQLKVSSIAKYLNNINSYIIPYFGDNKISNITRNDVTVFSRYLLEFGGIKVNGLSPKTVNSILSVLKNIFEFAMHEKGLKITDISDITVKQSQKPMRILSRQEQSRLSEFLCSKPSPCHLGILLCLYTGLRIGEICALKWEDICIQEQYLYIHHTMQRIQVFGKMERKTEVVIQSPKSDCSIRKIPIPNEVLQLLIPAQKDRSAFLLTGNVYSYIEPRCMENRFKAVAKECGISGVKFHTLRHTFATRCIELGFDIKSLSEILGHASVNITLNRYVHPSMELKQKNMNMLSELLVTK